jgi:hypothetical protein
MNGQEWGITIVITIVTSVVGASWFLAAKLGALKTAIELLRQALDFRKAEHDRCEKTTTDRLKEHSTTMKELGGRVNEHSTTLKELGGRVNELATETETG